MELLNLPKQKRLTSVEKVAYDEILQEENDPWPLRKHLHDIITVPTQYILSTYVRRRNTSHSLSVTKDPLGIISFNDQNFKNEPR
jgi:hypothetical protein